jgi:hypothetical protein
MTIIWFASFTEEILCDIIIVVVSFIIFLKFSKITFSVLVSNADKQSSKINILGFFIIALAIEILCF